jgi:flagellar biosynthesis/type III secretory pathway M-ring protein FliF/YscJ
MTFYFAPIFKYIFLYVLIYLLLIAGCWTNMVGSWLRRSRTADEAEQAAQQDEAEQAAQQQTAHHDNDDQ